MPLKDYLSALKWALLNNNKLLADFLIHQYLVDDDLATPKQKEEL